MATKKDELREQIVDLESQMNELRDLVRGLQGQMLELQTRVESPEPAPTAVSSLWGESKTRRAGTRNELMFQGLGFCWCPAGEFQMGSPAEEVDRRSDEIPHHVKLTKGFWLLETPVTQRVYELLMNNNPSEFKGDDLPVENVCYDEAIAFCNKLDALLPDSMSVTLPTEAQWEYACRAGTTTPYWWGDSLNGDRANCDGNYPSGTEERGRFHNKTTPVRSYGCNEWNLYDMHGNVWEWCKDWIGDYSADAVVDPEGPKTGTLRAARGGSWSNIARRCRAAYRYGFIPGVRSSECGFRIALTSTE